MEKKLILKSDVLDAFKKVGVKPGQVIMVHIHPLAASDMFAEVLRRSSKL